MPLRLSIEIRVERGIVVHLELAVELEIRPSGARFREQEVEAGQQVVALREQALELARAEADMLVVRVGALRLRALQRVGGDLQLTHAVVLGAESLAHGAAPSEWRELRRCGVQMSCRLDEHRPRRPRPAGTAAPACRPGL